MRHGYPGFLPKPRQIIDGSAGITSPDGTQEYGRVYGKALGTDAQGANYVIGLHVAMPTAFNAATAFNVVYDSNDTVPYLKTLLEKIAAKNTGKIATNGAVAISGNVATVTDAIVTFTGANWTTQYFTIAQDTGAGLVQTGLLIRSYNASKQYLALQWVTHNTLAIDLATEPYVVTLQDPPPTNLAAALAFLGSQAGTLIVERLRLVDP